MFGVTGGTTFNYQIVGVDPLGGLTAASSAIQVTNAPTIFNPSFVNITSISASAGVVTVVFATNINAAMNNTVHITGAAGAAASWNGVWPVASAPNAYTVTFALSGASGTGTANTGEGRLSNAQQISSITRSAAGVIIITTLNNIHGYVRNATFNPAFVIINGVTGDTSLNGYYIIDSIPTANTLTCNTGNFVASANMCCGYSYSTVFRVCVPETARSRTIHSGLLHLLRFSKSGRNDEPHW